MSRLSRWKYGYGTGIASVLTIAPMLQATRQQFRRVTAAGFCKRDRCWLSALCARVLAPFLDARR
eukprot:1951075-Prymnesium_polylepis.1